MIARRKFEAGGIIENLVVPIDALATPLNNAELLYDLKAHTPYPGRNPRDPYPNINDSPHAQTVAASVFVSSILFIIGNFFIQFYKKILYKKSLSLYSFFEKDPGIDAYLKKKAKDEDHYPPEILQAIAYYYNPDLPAFVCWRRRSWARLIQSRRYLSAQRYKKNNELSDIYQHINDQLASYINGKHHYGKWVAECYTGKWTIRPIEPSFKLKKQEEPKLTLFKQAWNFFEARLADWEKASFMYWVWVFIFFFLPGVGVIGSVVWPPILIGGVCLLGIWINNLRKMRQARKMAPLYEEVVYQEEVASLVENIKRHLQVKALPHARISMTGSKLQQEMKEIIYKGYEMLLVRAILNGFIGGFFRIFFISWFLFSVISLGVSFSPLGLAVIAGATLILGLAWGIYSAWQYFKINDHLNETRLNHLAQLEKDDVDIPTLSLREYDRLFRLGHINASGWTLCKQIVKRAWVGLLGMGTGILLLKLSAYGLTTSILTALGITTSIAFFPMLGVFLAGGLLYAAWRIYDYQLKSQEVQLDNVLSTWTHPVFMAHKKVKPNQRFQTIKHQRLNQSCDDIFRWKFEQRHNSLTLQTDFFKDKNVKLNYLKRSVSCPADLNMMGKK